MVTIAMTMWIPTKNLGLKKMRSDLLKSHILFIAYNLGDHTKANINHILQHVQTIKLHEMQLLSIGYREEDSLAFIVHNQLIRYSTCPHMLAQVI